MERLASGIEGFDALVSGGFPVDASVVVQGPPGQEKLAFALTFLAEGLRNGGSGLAVVASQSPESLLAALRSLGVDVDTAIRENRLRVVDWYSWGEETVTDVEERGGIVRTSVDLTNAGAAVSRGIAALSGAGPKRAIVEMLSPAMNVYELSQVYAFAQSTKRKFDRFHFTALFLLEKDIHSPAALSTLHQPFDGVVEIERSRSGDRIIRKIGILHLRDTHAVSDFVPFEFTERGLLVGQPAPVPDAASTPVPPVPPPPARPRPDAPASRVHMLLELARERLKVDPEDRDALFTLAAALATVDDPRGAVRALERLETVDPEYPGLWAFEMKLFARLGDADRWRRSREKALAASPEAESLEAIPCPFCHALVAAGSAQCPHCMADLREEADILRGLEDLVRTTVQEMVQEELGTKAPPATPAAPRPVAKSPVLRPVPRSKGLTNGLLLERHPIRPIAVPKSGRTNGLTNGLRGRTNGLTNGLGRTNGLTNGLRGRTNGLTNGLGRTNGLTNGLRNQVGRPGPARPATRYGRFKERLASSPWTRYGIPLTVAALLVVPLFFLWIAPGVPHPIQIDGAFGDWTTQSLVSVPGAASSRPNIEIVRIGVADNVEDLAYYAEVAGTVLQGSGAAPGLMDTVRLFLDADGSSATGYQVQGIGADRLLEVSGYGGQVRRADLYEFDANRDVRDWNGWIKGTPIQAAASGSRLELQASWIAVRHGSGAPIATFTVQSWDGTTRGTPVLLALSGGSLVVEQTPAVPPVLSGSGVPLLAFTATAFRQAVAFDSLNLEIVGTSAATAASSLELVDGSGSVLSLAVPLGRRVTFGFASQQIDPAAPRTYSVRGDFAGASGDTFGVRIAAREDVGSQGGVVSLETLAAIRSLGYVGAIPAAPRVDGGFEEWASATPDPLGEASTQGNANIDIAHTGAIHNGSSLYLYTDVAGRILAGTQQPATPQPVPSMNASAADTDRDTVPDSVDPRPFDFNNDGTPDAQTGGDYDGDGIIDYGFSGGTDSWLNTTLPMSFPAPYAGLSVSVYIGPTTKPPLLGEDVLRIFLDVDNSTWTGYSIGGLGADRLVEIRGKDAQVTQSALLSFSGSFPGDWSWTPMSPVTVASGYHAIELSVPGNASHVHVEMGDFWGSVDSTSGPPVAPTQTSFVVATATSVLSVPWVQAGPQLSGAPIDGSSNAATTVYNHQRKVVRAGDVTGQTACDATNSDGCWYVLFYDQLAQDTYDSGPSTQTLTIGTAVSGTFPTDVLSNNNAYIDYREANTGSQTTVSNNPTAIGTNPACAWTNCANAETSNNLYADMNTPNRAISFRTFGFTVPSGSSINKVEFGIEAYQDAGGDDQVDTMELSWNAGTTYCSNPFATTPGTSDPNAYTYFDQTTCTGHTWAAADFTGDQIAWQGNYRKVGSVTTPIHVDAVIVRVTYMPVSYALQIQYGFAGVPAGDAQTLNVEAFHSADENVNVQVLSPPSTWNTRLTLTATSDPGTPQTYSLTSVEYNTGSPTIRFVDANGGDATQTDLWVDLAILTTTMTKSPGTETVTTGSRVAGTFPPGISAADGTYIQYREANTASTTVSSKNPTAIGTNPACAWTNCANGETSNNAYADSSTANQAISFKTFGFGLPAGSTISQVRFGLEAYQDAGGNDGVDTMALSWNGGTTYCTNTFQIVPGTSDTNAYAYSDQTTCTGHAWAPSDFTGDNIGWKGQYMKVTNTATPVHVDAVVVEVTYTPPPSYQTQVQYDWSAVPAGDVYTLKVKGYRQDEDVNVQVLTPPSTWTTRVTIAAASNTQYTYALTSIEYNSGSPSIRFVDASGGDATQSDFWLDQAVITTTTSWDQIYIMRSLDTSGSTWGSQVLLASGRVGGDPLLHNYDSAEPSIAMDAAGYLHVVWVSAGSPGNQQTLNLVRYTRTTVADPTQAQLASAANWQSVTSVDDASLGFMPTISTDGTNNPHVAWSGSKTSGTVYYKNMFGGAWKPTVSWGSAYTGISVDVAPQNNDVNLVRYYEAATNEIQYTVCKNLATSNCDAASEFTKWDGTVGYDTVATSVESGGYPSLATSYEANGDLWIAYAKDVDGTTRAVYVRFLDYPSNGFATPETVDSLSGTRFTRPTIGLDRGGNLNALYVATAGPQLYYKVRTGGVWGSRTALDSTTDDPSLVVRAPDNGMYGNTVGAVYWKASTSETYFVAIPEFESVALPIAGCIVLVFAARHRRARQAARDSDDEDSAHGGPS